MSDYKNYEDWVDSLTPEQLEEAYMIGGGNDDIALMRAYWLSLKDE